MSSQLMKEYYGIIVISVVVAVAIIVGIFTQQLSVTMPQLWVFGIIIGLILAFIIPFIASVRFHSPNVFDGDGNVWSFNEEQMATISGYGTKMAIIAVGGFDNPKKALAHENITGSRTILLMAPARLVESVGNRRFLVVRAPLRKLGLWETKALMTHHELAPVLGRWGVEHATIYLSMWTLPSLLPITFSKHRVDFEQIASYMMRRGTEIGVRRELVDEIWGRTLTEIERIQKKHPAPPTGPPTAPPEPQKEEQK